MLDLFLGKIISPEKISENDFAKFWESKAEIRANS